MPHYATEVITFEICCPDLDRIDLLPDVTANVCDDDCFIFTEVELYDSDGTTVLETIALPDSRVELTSDGGADIIITDITGGVEVCLVDGGTLGAYTITATYTDLCEVPHYATEVITFVECRAISSLQVRGYNGAKKCEGLQETYNELSPVPYPGVNDPGISWLYLTNNATPNVKNINFSVCYDVPGTIIEYRYRYMLDYPNTPDYIPVWNREWDVLGLDWTSAEGTADPVGCTNEFISACMDAPSNPSNSGDDGPYYCYEFEIQIRVNYDDDNIYTVHIW